MQAEPSSFQINDTGINALTATTSLGQSSSTATGAVYQVTNNTNMGVAFTAGTGVTQTNVPGDAYIGASQLAANVNLVWGLNSQFAPTNAFPGINYQFPIGGVIGVGGSDRFIANLTFNEIVTPNTGPVQTVAVGSLSLDETYTNATGSPLPFSTLLSGNDAFNGGVDLPASNDFDTYQFQITGTVEFRAKNDLSPSTFDLSSDSSMSALDYDSEPTGDQNFSDIETVALPQPSSVAMGVVSMLLLGLVAKAGLGRRQEA
jgi:hypothetical protein